MRINDTQNCIRRDYILHSGAWSMTFTYGTNFVCVCVSMRVYPSVHHGGAPDTHAEDIANHENVLGIHELESKGRQLSAALHGKVLHCRMLYDGVAAALERCLA